MSIRDSSVHHFRVDDYVVMTEKKGVVLDLDQIVAFGREVEKQLEGGIHRVLADCRGTRKAYTFGDAYRLADVFRDAPGFKNGRVALLGSYDAEFEKLQALAFHFREAGADVRAFIDRDAAVAWLTSDGPDAPSDSA